MADVENPAVAVEAEAEAAVAEPGECSRHMLVCTMGFLFFAFIVVLTVMDTTELESNGPAVIAVLCLATFGMLCFGIVFTSLVAEWVRGNPEFPAGHRLVDDLIQSDRFILCEFAHQFMLHVAQDPLAHYGDA